MDNRSQLIFSSCPATLYGMESDGDSDFSGEQVQESADPSTSVVRKVRTGSEFPKHIKTILESQYSRGLTGWGSKHATSIDEVVKSTGLSESQVKVCKREMGGINASCFTYKGRSLPLTLY